MVIIGKTSKQTQENQETGETGKRESTLVRKTENTGTVEVGSLHTLRLESLKLVFQPLHKFLVNKLKFW